MDKLPKNDKVQQATRDMETEDDEVTRSNEFLHAFIAAARVEARSFIEDCCLCMDEDWLPVVNRVQDVVYITYQVWTVLFGEIDLFG